MIVVDASCLVEVVTDSVHSAVIAGRLLADTDHVAPHVVDAEVLGVVRRHWLAGLLDDTAAAQAVEDLRDWPGERYGLRSLLARAWELRHTVRSSDALYVALAEVLDATLVTTDARLAAASGPACRIEVLR